VRLTHRLTNSPACLVTGEHEMSANLERILKSVGQDAPGIKPIMELNPEHPLVAKLNGAEGEHFGDLTSILFDQALLAEGGTLDDPASFVAKLNKMLLEMSA
jgi:molecular chaperone HtpG